MRAFIHHDGALGDVLLSLPAIRAVAAQATVHFAGRQDVATLLREAGIAAEISSSGSGRYTAWYGGAVDGPGREFLNRFDRAFLFTVDVRSAFAAAVRAVLPGTAVIATVPPATAAVHAAQYRLDQLQGFVPPGSGPLLPLPGILPELASGMLRRAGYDGLRPLIALHPGSGGKEKNWALDRYRELAGALRGRLHAFLVFLSGPAEDDAVREGLGGWAGGGMDAVHYDNAELITVAAVLRIADLYIGNDSGVSHLAGAVGCSTIALFGPTDPDLWRPQGDRVHVLRSPRLEDLPVERVLDLARMRLAPPAASAGNG